METKRSRWEPVDSEAGAPTDQDGQPAKRPKMSELGDTSATKRPAIDMSVIEKAKAALQKQKELKEKLEKLKQAKAAKATATATLTQREDAQPGSADGGGAVSLLVELDKARREQFQGQEDTSAHYDPFLHARGMGRRSRPALQFVEAGTFQKEADMVRLKAQFGEGYVNDLEQRRQRELEEAEGAGLDANLVPLGPRSQIGTKKEDKNLIPDVEWWDAKILVDKTSYQGWEIREDRITHYVEHPVLLEPPAEAPPPPPQPLKLTKKEIKKLRTQRRIARENEKQDLIRQGLLEPPKPKVKISNLMRVLGAEATADPTAIEAEVRRQMAERAAAHEDRNLARQLTPAERREKKLKKLLDVHPAAGGGGAGEVTHVAVYKVGDLSLPQLRFKVEVNAKENHMTGIALCVSGKFSIVIVEGGPKTQRRYEKLMLRRIQWNNVSHLGDDDNGNGNDDDDMKNVDSDDRLMPVDGGQQMEGVVTVGKNYCQLVWTGIIKEPAFGRSKFKLEQVRNEDAARQILAERGVEHYWDLAAALST
jgi:U4/U6 small nuclear ribonucleoprotein PRP3